MARVLPFNVGCEVVQSGPILASYTHAWGWTGDANVSPFLAHTRAGAVLTLAMPFEIVGCAEALLTVAAQFEAHIRFSVSVHVFTSDYQHILTRAMTEQHLRSI
jgi:hypothetical protein